MTERDPDHLASFALTETDLRMLAMVLDVPADRVVDWARALIEWKDAEKARAIMGIAA